jgi:hypothetical protein
MADKRGGRARLERRNVPGYTRAPGVLGPSIYRTTKLSIKLVAWALVVSFGWLKLNGVEFVPIAKDLPAEVVLKFSLALYYACWVAGTLLDTETQEQLYSAQPNAGRMPGWGWVLVGFLTAVFAVLCFVNTYSWFAVLLTAFFLINVVGWRYLIRRVLPSAVAQSRLTFARAPFKLERVHLVYDRYLCGRWQIHRFAAGGIVLIVLNVFVFSDVLDRASVMLAVGSRDLAISGAILCFVLLMESWIWFIRLRLSTALALLEYLDERYGTALAKTL